jgi:hypothetical protein
MYSEWWDELTVKDFYTALRAGDVPLTLWFVWEFGLQQKADGTSLRRCLDEDYRMGDLRDSSDFLHISLWSFLFLYKGKLMEHVVRSKSVLMFNLFRPLYHASIDERLLSTPGDFTVDEILCKTWNTMCVDGIPLTLPFYSPRVLRTEALGAGAEDIAFRLTRGHPMSEGIDVKYLAPVPARSRPGPRQTDLPTWVYCIRGGCVEFMKTYAIPSDITDLLYHIERYEDPRFLHLCSRDDIQTLMTRLSNVSFACLEYLLDYQNERYRDPQTSHSVTGEEWRQEAARCSQLEQPTPLHERLMLLKSKDIHGFVDWNLYYEYKYDM